MARNLLPPLRDDNNIGLAEPPGTWQPFDEAWTLSKHIHTPAEVARRGESSQITSIPSPWARMLLFRHALEEGPNHPLYLQVVSDILDTLELTFFQSHLRGQCFFRTVDLLQLEEEFPLASPLYLRALTAQVPQVPLQQPRPGQVEHTSLDAVTLVYYGDSPETQKLIALSSPFTLFVTPQDRARDIEGYYEFGNKPDALFRDLGSRDPGFIVYLRTKLLPQLKQNDRVAGGLLGYLDQALTRFRPSSADISLEPMPFIPGMGGISLFKLGELRVTSALSIRPTRGGTERPPLVLTDNPPSQVYYNRVPLPRPWILDPAADRKQLPGTHVRYPWVYPAEDFLEPVLVEMPGGLQNTYRDRRAETDTSRYLLPLKPRFFEFFEPEDVPRILSISRNPHGIVTVQLDVPVQGTGGSGQVVVQKMYSPNQDTVQLDGTYLCLWPNFQADDWTDHYLLHFENTRRAADALRVEFLDQAGNAYGPAERQPSGKMLPGVDSVEREKNTQVYHTPWTPRVLRLVLPETGAAGIILPILGDRNTGIQEETSWQVGIDFGTSNTIIAMKGTSGGKGPEVIKLGDATRLDLVGLPMPMIADRWETLLSYYFFPEKVERGPFPSHIFWRTGITHDIPGIHASIPFSGALSGDAKNALLPNLKWSDNPHANHLTRLFLRQVVMMVEAEALARYVSPRNVRYAWSYPMAFSGNKINLFHKMWEDILGSEDRAESRDESTCSLLYFQSHSDDFDPDAVAAKVTIDIGGGTSDIAAYAGGGPLFRDSILFGGQDLTGSTRQETETTILNPFVKQLLSYADAHGFHPNQKEIIDRYTSSHSKFNYLIRTDWFREHQADIAAQQWFERFQIATFYFFSVILFYVGLHLREENLSGERLPNIVYVGGNGSRFLDWLTALTEWSAGERRVFFKAFSRILQSGMDAKETVAIEIRSSGNPKHEVAVGLLQEAAEFEMEAAPSAVLGEDVTFGETVTRKAHESTAGTSISPSNSKRIVFAQPLAKREITRLNQAFIEQLSSIGFGYANVQFVRTQLEGMNESAFTDALAVRLRGFFEKEGDQVYNGSLLMIEASACLARLL